MIGKTGGKYCSALSKVCNCLTQMCSFGLILYKNMMEGRMLREITIMAKNINTLGKYDHKRL